MSDRQIADLGIRAVQFANGVQLNLKKTDFEPGKVAFQLLAGEGSSSVPRNVEGLPFMADMVMSIDGLEARVFLHYGYLR